MRLDAAARASSKRDSVRIFRSYQPCELAAPIMADEMETLRSARVHQGQRVARQPIARILLYLERTCPGRIASLIRSHGAKTGRRQGAQLIAPHLARLRKSMQQQDRRTRSGTGVSTVKLNFPIAQVCVCGSITDRSSARDREANAI
jgi:hypothetical protein